MINNDQELIAAVQNANNLLQQISVYLSDNPISDPKGAIRFPRGFIRMAAFHRSKISFVTDRTLQKNISYALMSHDVIRWITFRTDLSGQASEMMIKQGILIVGTICEAVTVFLGERSLGRGSNYGTRIARLRELNVIDERAMILLLWLWRKRNQIHLHLNEFAEYSHYEFQDWYKSVTAWHALRDGLQVWRGKQ